MPTGIWTENGDSNLLLQGKDTEKVTSRSIVTNGYSPHFPRDLALATILLLLGSLFGSWYTLEHSGAPRGKYTFWMGPAYGLATGHGLQAPKPGASPAYDEFMAKKRDAFPADAVPVDLPMRPANDVERTHLYLIGSVALCWGLFGVSWVSLAPLYGLLFGLNLALVYGLFRLGVNRVLALGGTLLFALAPSHLVVFPHLRDYAKAPFILAALLLMGWLVRRTHSGCRVLALSALLGAVIGVGLGFRQDVQICLVPAVAVLFFFLEGRPWQRLPLKVGALVVLVGVFVLAAWPVLAAMQRGGSYPAHNIIGGYSDYAEDMMGADSTHYEWMPLFNDFHIAATISGYAQRNLDSGKPVEYLGPAYDQAGRQIILGFARTFPCDMITRGVASTFRVIEETPLCAGEPDFPVGSFLQRALDFTGPLTFPFPGKGRYIAAAALLILAAFNLRWALAAGFLTLFFAGYPCLQFHYRHFFHLGFLTWWFPALLLQFIGMGAVALGRVHLGFVVRPLGRNRITNALKGALRTICTMENGPASGTNPAANTSGKSPFEGEFRGMFSLPRVLAFTAATALLFLAWGGAWLWQQRAVGHLFDQYAEVRLEPLNTEQHALQQGANRWTLFTPTDLFPEAFTELETAWQQRIAYFVAELRGAGPLPLRFQYGVETERADFSYTTLVPLAEDSEESVTRYFFPVYEAPPGAAVGDTPSGRRVFQGVAVPEAQQNRVAALYRVANDENFPLLPHVVLPENWAEEAARHAALTPRPLFPAMRTHAAGRNNILSNGGFEDWPEDALAPEGTQAPKAQSHIASETAMVAKGRRAIRQTWMDGNPAPPLDLFGLWVSGLKPNTAYDLVVEASNEGGVPVGIGAWHVIAPQGKVPRIVPLAYPVVGIPATKGFQRFHGTFRTADMPPDSYVFLAPVCLGQGCDGAEVIWDQWRLARVRKF